MKTAMRALLCTTALALWAFPARADEGVSVNLVPNALAGRDKPRLTVRAGGPVAALSLELERSDGQSLRRSAGRLAPGQEKVFELEQPQGTFKWNGRLIVRFPKGPPQEQLLALETTLLPPPQVSIAQDAVDLAARTVTLRMDRPPGEVVIKVQSDEGAVVDEVRREFPDAGAGDPVVVPWTQDAGVVVMRIDVRAADRFGFFRDVELYPWKIEIPHEDVLFETGKSDILPGERPKLDDAWEHLARDIAKYGRFAAVKLYVAGHTDTVGDAARNQTLSQARAQAIARYFRSRGARLPVYFAGFGETGLARETPDETPEQLNRRARYIVAIEAPHGAHWTKLP